MRIPVTKTDAIEALKMCKNSRIFVPSNEVLDHAIDALEKTEKISDEYERGCNDAWELMKKIIGNPNDDDNYTVEELKGIFGADIFPSNIIQKHTYSQAIAKVEAYEKKKEEESKKPVRGDEVKVESGCYKFTGTYFGEDEEHYWVLVQRHEVPQRLGKSDNWTVTKTGKHIELF